MMDTRLAAGLDIDRVTAAALAEARHGDPFAVLGPHETPDGVIVRVFVPGAERVEVLRRSDGSLLARLENVETEGLYAGHLADAVSYLLRISWPGAIQETEDPYAFGLLLGDLDLHLFNEGRHFELGSVFGAHAVTIDGISGVRFSVWAPNAHNVSVVGDFNSWDARRHPMRFRMPAGVWELFVPRIGPGERYKYEIVGADGVRLPQKADPVANRTEPPPATASVVAAEHAHAWRDGAWMRSRAERHSPDRPIAIYEVHLGSWMRSVKSWDDAIEHLVPYVADMGFSHVEVLPITEHPFGGSWGYQPTALFAPTARLGAPDGFARLVDACHAAEIGVIVDWVPAHFPTDPHGLIRFDGTALYEHLDPREGFHRDWDTLIYNYGREEVRGFLIASALHWLERFHIDGLRVDAVASMLYRDYSRHAGEWIPNVHGGRENLEAIAFLRQLNTVVAERFPGVMTIAEESTAWPGVSGKVSEGGLGFSYKWNMGWMHDTLAYMSNDPIHRSYHHNDFTFGLLYAFSERFILPLSHDEIVYGKGSLLAKMPGDRWQRFANLRAYLGFMWAHPGKKLLFMGGELAQDAEWSHDKEVDWSSLADPDHQGVQRVVRDLNRVYRKERALHELDASPGGFRWVIGDDRANSVFAFLRFAGADAPPVLAIANMTPVPRHAYRVGVPRSGLWREIFNSDTEFYSGSGVGNFGAVRSNPIPSHGMDHSLELVLPPLATVLLRHEG
jgi:1,4-alpha-glucan branching enzyme